MSPAERRRLIVVLGALTALGPFTIDLYLPAFPAVALSLETSAAAIQATLAGTTAGIAIGQLVMGPWSDRVGRRLPLIIATVAHVLASLACAIAPDVVFLTIARFGMGAAAAAGGVVAAAMVRDLYSGVPMMKLSSRLAMINGAAPIIAPVLGSVLLVWTDWRGIFVVLAAYAAIVVTATIVWVPESLPVYARSSGGFRAFGGIARRLFSDRIFVMLMLIGGMVWGSEFSYLAGSPFLIQDEYGFSATAYGLFFAINAVGYVAGTQLGARVAHRIAPQTMLAVATGVMVVAAIMVVLMTASQFITQLQIVSKNISDETKASPMFRQQKVLLYILPFVFLFSGFTFPLGVMFYWLTSNIWTMVQQFLIIRNMPMPGTEAAKQREERLARKGKLVVESPSAETVVVQEKKPTQRQQPMGKNRAKKTGGAPGTPNIKNGS